MTRSDADEIRFKSTVDCAVLVSGLVPKLHDLDFVARELDKCDSFGHVTDPTMYRNSMPDREALKVLIDGARKFAAAAERFGGLRAAILAKRERPAESPK